MKQWKERAARVFGCALLLSVGAWLLLQGGAWNMIPGYPMGMTAMAAGPTDGQAGEPEETDWEMEFTDTDTRRGTLALRGDVFQGFGGTVRLWVMERESGRQISVSLSKNSQYMANRELKPGIYVVCGLEADSEGRKFGCSAEPMEMEIETGRVSVCRVFVSPDSVYQLPYEESEPEEILETEGEKNGSDSTEPASSSMSGSMAGEENGTGDEKETETSGSRIPLAFFAAALGLAASLRGLFCAMRGRQGR